MFWGYEKKKLVDGVYHFYNEDNGHVVNIDKDYLESSLRDIQNCLSGIKEVLEQGDYNDDFETFLYDCFDTLHDVDNSEIVGLESEIEDCFEYLGKPDDDFLLPDEEREECYVTFKLLGFKNDSADKKRFERVLIDDDTKEVVEEVYIEDKNNFLYRLRTIYWEKTKTSKHSTDIIYTTLEPTFAIIEAVNNETQI